MEQRVESAEGAVRFAYSGYSNPETFFKKLLTAEQVAASVHLKTERLLELAEAGLAPHIRIDGGTPLFIQKELTEWVVKKLSRFTDGVESFSLLICPQYMKKPEPASLPIELFSITDKLKEFEQQLTPCVYFLVRDKRVVYVGQSINLGGRVGQHLNDRKAFDKIYYLPVPRSELDRVEGAFIRALKPELNKTSNAGHPNQATLDEYGFKLNDQPENSPPHTM